MTQEGFKRIVNGIASLDGIVKDNKVELVSLPKSDNLIEYEKKSESNEDGNAIYHGVVIESLRNMLFIAVRDNGHNPGYKLHLEGIAITGKGVTKVFSSKRSSLSHEAEKIYECRLVQAGL